jgi:uncharacterized Rmd1/YagE family protein
MDDLLKFFHARKSAYRTAVRRFDEVIYTPYTYDLKSQNRNGSVAVSIHDPEESTDREPSLPTIHESAVYSASPVETRRPEIKLRGKRFQNQQPEGEADVFLFEYGVCVLN